MTLEFFTKDKFRKILSSNKEPDPWYDAMIHLLPKYDIVTPKRLAAFLAQTAYESTNYTKLEENLNYTESRLSKVFSRYFGPGKRNAAEYAHQPEKLANYVYMDKYRTKSGALGNIKEGDGWRFRGRGIKQITGRSNYAAFGKTLNKSAEEVADYLTTKPGAIESALYFWDQNGLNSYADREDNEGLTRRINGGINGLSTRTKNYYAFKKILESDSTVSSPVEPVKEDAPTTPGNNILLNIGSTGEDVAKVQRKLGLNPDGIFGPNTKRAVKYFQYCNRMFVDGVVGPKTWAKLFNL